MFENIVSLSVGVEPTTSRLTAERSTTELRKQGAPNTARSYPGPGQKIQKINAPPNSYGACSR